MQKLNSPIFIWTAAIVLAVLLFFGLAIFINTLTHESTDDAFIAGHIVSIAPRISGQVSAVHVLDNQLVRSNDLLLEIDPADYANTLAQKQSAARAQDANVKTVLAGDELMRKKVATAEAGARKAQADADASAASATMSQLAQQQIGNASGLYNLMRNLGGSIGIAFVTTMLARGAQTHQALMVGNLSSANPAFARQFAAAKSVLGHQTDSVTATKQAYNAVYSLLDQQAHLWAFVDNFYLFGLLALAGIPLVFLFKRIATVKKPAAAGH